MGQNDGSGSPARSQLVMGRASKLGISLPSELVRAMDAELAIEPGSKSAFVADAVRGHIAARQAVRLAREAALLVDNDEEGDIFEALRP